MGLCNSPDMFQEKINELFSGLDYVRTYIDKLLILSNTILEDHIKKIEKVLIKIKIGWLQNECRKILFR